MQGFFTLYILLYFSMFANPNIKRDKNPLWYDSFRSIKNMKKP